MRAMGMRQLSKGELIKTLEYSAAAKLVAQSEYVGLRRRWLATVAVAAGAGFAGGIAFALAVLHG